MQASPTGNPPERRAAPTRRSAIWNIGHSLETAAGPAGSQSIQRALILLNLVGMLARNSPYGASLADLTRATKWAKPTVHRVLGALVHAGYVEQEPQSQCYRLGVQAHVLGQLAGEKDSGLRQAARDSLSRLSQLYEDASFLTVRQGSYAICAHREEGHGVIRNHALAVGDRHPLGIGAGSLAILAALPDHEVQHIVSANAQVLQRLYPGIGPDVLYSLVHQTREQGYSLNEGRVVAGSWAIGMAIPPTDGPVNAALSIATIEQRLGPERRRELADSLRHETSTIASVLAAETAGQTGIGRAV
jgi:DNA-binding IclR family transcriptional regulator